MERNGSNSSPFLFFAEKIIVFRWILKSSRIKVGIVLKILAVIRISNLGEIRVSELSDGRVKWETADNRKQEGQWVL